MMVWQGEEADTFFILLSGSAKAYHDSVSGKRYTLTVFYPGDFFGENAIIDGAIRVFSVQAISQTQAILVNRTDLRKWLYSDVHFSVFLNYEMARRLMYSGERSVVACLHSLKSRILRLIHSRALESGYSNLEISPSQLAEELGVSSRSIQRILKGLHDSGLIRYRRGSLTITSLRELENSVFSVDKP